MELVLLDRLRKINHWTAIAIGICLALCTGFILLDIILRQVSSSFGGSEEISGYAMAIITSWGMGYTLLELSHVRIDFLRSKFHSRGRAVMDLVSMTALSLTVFFIAFRSWPVVERSIINDYTSQQDKYGTISILQEEFGTPEVMNERINSIRKDIKKLVHEFDFHKT